jgi:hypothetical protein
MADPSSARDVTPLFRENDRSTRGHFDPCPRSAVHDDAAAIIEVRRGVTMPSGGLRRADDVDLVRCWIAGGMAQ